MGITDFLRNTPQLKTLIYSHDTLYAHLPQDWDICGFINAIAEEAGSHLDTLSVEIVRVRSLLPGKAILRFPEVEGHAYTFGFGIVQHEGHGHHMETLQPVTASIQR